MAMKQGELSPALVPKVFEHEQFGKIRFIKQGDEIWFVGKDVCRVLGYANSRKALADHVPDKYKRGSRIVTPLGGAQNTILISESGLYRLIMRSNLPAAEKFMDWVCEEVLPSIRKYGYYSVTEKPAEKPLTEREKLLKKINDENPDDEIEFTGITLDTICGKQFVSYNWKFQGEVAEKLWAEVLTGKTAFSVMTYEKTKKDD